METSEDILRKYPYFVMYKPPYREGSSWIRYPGCKDQDYLLCKNVDDIFTCIMQCYLSCIYFEKSVEYNVDSSSSFEEMIERYGELPDITEKMKMDLIEKFISAKKGLLYGFRIWPTNLFTSKYFTHSIEFKIQNHEKIIFEVGFSRNRQESCDFIHKNTCSDFQPRGIILGSNSSDYITFYSIQKINEQIGLLEIRNYQDVVNDANIDHFIERKMLYKLQLLEKSKRWIRESFKIMTDCRYQNILLDRTNGFLINEFDFENIATSSFFYIRIYVLNKKKFHSSHATYFNKQYTRQQAIDYMKEIKRNYLVWSLLKQNNITDLESETIDFIKSYLFDRS